MKHKNVFWGLFFILSATLIILNQFDVLIGVSIFKLIISLFLLPVIFKSIKHLFFAGVLFPLAFIGIIFAEPLGIENLTPWPILGVALFLSIGLSFMFPNKHKSEFENCFHGHHEQNWQSESSDDSEVNVYLKFGGCSKYINSKNLKKVHIDCKFGGTKIFFDNSDIDGNEAVIDVVAQFAGVELYVPKNWIVKSEADCMLGGIEEKGIRNSGSVEKALILKGKIRFAGISIIYI
ncbi:MAG: LiaF-related protein [Oscillospiraceae bacterium]